MCPVTTTLRSALKTMTAPARTIILKHVVDLVYFKNRHAYNLGAKLINLTIFIFLGLSQILLMLLVSVCMLMCMAMSVSVSMRVSMPMTMIVCVAMTVAVTMIVIMTLSMFVTVIIFTTLQVMIARNQIVMSKLIYDFVFGFRVGVLNEVCLISFEISFENGI